MTIAEVENSFFRENGFLVVRGMLSADETSALRVRADEIGRDIDRYNRRDREESERISRDNQMDGEGIDGTRGGGAVANLPEIKINATHARRGEHVYPLRSRPVEKDEMRKLQNPSLHPFNNPALGVVSRLADHDELFRSFTTHPNLVSVLRELLGPNLKLWHDHIFSKPPLNDAGPYHGANRYHQDGFLYYGPLRPDQSIGGPGQRHGSMRSVTCWIALDEVTEEHGCLRYLPLSEKYGQFDFDKVADGLTPELLSKEVLTPLSPGDAIFHDHWTIHATGPNEARTMRRGWSLHFTDSESRFGDFAHDPNRPEREMAQTPDGARFMNGKIHGNFKCRLVCGREFPGGI